MSWLMSVIFHFHTADVFNDGKDEKKSTRIYSLSLLLWAEGGGFRHNCNTSGKFLNKPQHFLHLLSQVTILMAHWFERTLTGRCTCRVVVVVTWIKSQLNSSSFSHCCCYYWYYYYNSGFFLLPISVQPACQHFPIPHRCTTESCDVTRGCGQWQQRYTDTDGHSGHVGRRHSKPQCAGNTMRKNMSVAKQLFGLHLLAHFQMTFTFRVRRFPPCWMIQACPDSPAALASRWYWSATLPRPPTGRLTMATAWVSWCLLIRAAQNVWLVSSQNVFLKFDGGAGAAAAADGVLWLSQWDDKQS